MYLDEILAAQKRGEAVGIPSICSAHPDVIRQTVKVSQTFGVSPLIESTCNQVNQYGGYTGMTPKGFVSYVHNIASENDLPFENIILGGDHLGPSVWQNEPSESAMQKSEILVREYVGAGFTKIHLDCSMKLADDPAGALDIEIIANRVARLAVVAENLAKAALKAREPSQGLRYVIGTEVPIPGGAMRHEEHVRVTTVEDARQTIEVTRAAFLRQGLEDAWQRVIGLVVQPGVEFGDDFVLPYQPEAARELSKFIEVQPVVYEAHSTDYQTRDALRNLVKHHFAILKVGPALTFAFREAVFALAMIEAECIPKDQRSNVMQVLENVMLQHPEYWNKHYYGSEQEQPFKLKYSLSDRIRYYWVQPEVQRAFSQLMENLGTKVLPYSLLRQFVGDVNLTSVQVIETKVGRVLDDYFVACAN